MNWNQNEKLIVYLYILLFYSCENIECKQCEVSEWKIEKLEEPFMKILEVYPVLDSNKLTGAVDCMNLKQKNYVDADLWNLFDATLIDSLIIYDSTTILALEGRGIECCGNWLVFTLNDNSFEHQFIDQNKSRIINPNWKSYPNKPGPILGD